MQLSEIQYKTATPIDGYGPGFFRVAGEALEGSICVTADSASAWGGFADLQILEKLAGHVDVVLVGTGEAKTPIPAAFRNAFEAVNLGVDPMTSPSACRTFNVLLAEGRRVAVLLLPV